MPNVLSSNEEEDEDFYKSDKETQQPIRSKPNVPNEIHSTVATSRQENITQVTSRPEAALTNRAMDELQTKLHTLTEQNTLFVSQIETLGMQNDTLNKQIDYFKGELESKTHELEGKSRDVGKLTQKLMTQEEELINLKQDAVIKDADIKKQRSKLGDMESSIIERNIFIAQMQDEIDELKSFRTTNETLKKQIRQREEEVGVLKAKQYLDMYTISFKLVPEYPDLVEENYDLQSNLQEKVELTESLKQ